MEILLAGEYKTGKTVSACTFPKPLLLLDFDDGFSSCKTAKKPDGSLVVSDWEEVTQVTFQKSKTYPLSFVTDMKGGAPAFAAESVHLMSEFNKIMASLQKGEGIAGNGVKYKTIVIDSLTTMFRLWNECVKFSNGRSVLQIPDYETLAVMLFGQFIPNVKALPIPFKIFIDHIDMEKDDLSGRIIEFPIGTSRAQGRKLGKEFDEVWRQETQGDKYVWRTKKGSGLMQVGSRLSLPDMTEAQFSNLYQFLPEDVKAELTAMDNVVSQ